MGSTRAQKRKIPARIKKKKKYGGSNALRGGGKARLQAHRRRKKYLSKKEGRKVPLTPPTPQAKGKERGTWG